MGIYVVQALKISRSVGGVDQTVFEANVSGADLKTLPEGWARSGTHPSMARLVKGGDAGAFCILDDDPNAHAEWRSLKSIAPAVEPGEQLTLEWSELYDIGMGNRFDVNYGALGSGTYRFCADELEPTGELLASAPKIELVVLQPFWKTPGFWFFATTGLGLVLWLACRSIIRNKIRHHLALTEREHLVERERLRIARDLHDDLGARLTHISLLSGHAENEVTIGAAREVLQRISSMSRDLVAALYQTVWTVNPENDHLDALVNFLCQLANNLCEPLGIRCRTHCAEVPTERRVTSEVRHNVSLAVKEAVHNAVKHGRASEVVLRIEFTDPLLMITVEDDGPGFDPAKITAGYGLANMSRRMELIGGRFSIAVAAGAHIRFEVPTPATAYADSLGK
jgi:signal transduction histidine kinase